MYGTEPSEAAVAAEHTFAAAGLTTVVELGAGHGRDTLYLARRGLHVTTLDYAPATVEDISTNAQAAGLGDKITVSHDDVRRPYRFPTTAWTPRTPTC